MFFLLFELNGQRCGLVADRVVEVASVPTLNTIPNAPPALLGTFNYRGTLTPVVDFSVLAGGPPCRPLLSTRLIVTSHPCSDGQWRALGLVAEHVTETLSVPDADLQTPAPASATEHLHGATIRTPTGESIRIIEPETILPDNLQACIFPV